MKITAKQIRKLNAIYNDYMSIDDDSSLRSVNCRWVIIMHFRIFLKQSRSMAILETFVSSIAEYFKKHGFNVTEKSINYLISFWNKSDISSGSNLHIEKVLLWN